MHSVVSVRVRRAGAALLGVVLVAGLARLLGPGAPEPADPVERRRGVGPTPSAGPPPSATLEGRGAVPDAVHDGEGAGPAAPRGRAGGGPPDPGGLAGQDAGDGAGGAPPLPPGAACMLRVTLDVPEAWRSCGARVYALPAGARGADDAEALPTAEVPAAGDLVLPLPGPGPWDVGLACSLGQVLETDVAGVGEPSVRLVARGAASVAFVADGRPGPLERVHLRLRPPGPEEGGARAVSFPGRGQTAELGWEGWLGPEGTCRTEPLSAGVALRVRVSGEAQRRPADAPPGWRWVPDPEQVAAGDRVRLSRQPLGGVRVHLRRAQPLPEAWSQRGAAFVWVAVEATGPDGQPSYASTVLRADGTLQEDVLALALPPGGYDLGVGVGRAFVPERHRVEVRAGEVLDVEGALTPDASFRPGAAPAAAGAPADVLRLRLPAGRAGAWRVVAAVPQEEGGSSWTEFSGEAGPDTPPEIVGLAAPSPALLILGQGWASPPLELPTRGELDVPLRPAGMLAIVPERLPDPRLGRFALRRVDGRPLPWSVPAGGGPGPERRLEWGEAVEVRLGTLLGPLPAGTVELDLSLGGVHLERLAATVRAGVLTPLAVPLE